MGLLSALLGNAAEADVADVDQQLEQILADDEQVERAFRLVRDLLIFTNRRFILVDRQGMTGKKVEIYSLPYSSINMWSSENAGKLDWNSEIELWTRAGHIKIKLNKGADVRRLDSLIAWAVLKG
jgi:hypothetical protein